MYELDNMKELESKIIEYENYIEEHVSNVKLAYQKYGDQLCRLLNVNPNELQNKINIHDKSKYSDEEFEGYRQYFYTCSYEEKNEELFDLAWIHHQNYNPHHPEYWIDRSSGKYSIKDMPPLYIAEMLCDWEAMSMKFNENTYDYYIKNKDKKPFSENTKKILDNVVKKVFGE